jgi:hypothetical protein
MSNFPTRDFVKCGPQVALWRWQRDTMMVRE